MLSRARISAALESTSSLGLTLAVHAIGDAAVRTCLDAFESAPSSRSLPAVAGRSVAPSLRIEHAELIDAADVPRFARLGVVCSVQPCHLLYDIEALTRGLPHRLNRVLPLRDLIDSGCGPGALLWFGSDVPIVRPHPDDSIRAAVHRRREGMKQAIAPQQAISENEAWAAFAAG
jgi:predicted amidohydrolase YtcJ